MEQERKNLTIRMSQTARDLIAKLSDHLGINQTAVIEIAIRELAKKENIEQRKEAS